MSRRTEMIRCWQHGGAWEPRQGRVWGRDGHLGVNQAKALLWLAHVDVAVHPGDVVRLARCGPSLGWGALAVLRDAGCISWDEQSDPVVTITDTGRRSAAGYDSDPWGVYVERFPFALDGSTLRPATVIASSRRRSRHRGGLKAP